MRGASGVSNSSHTSTLGIRERVPSASFSFLMCQSSWPIRSVSLSPILMMILDLVSRSEGKRASLRAMSGCTNGVVPSVHLYRFPSRPPDGGDRSERCE